MTKTKATKALRRIDRALRRLVTLGNIQVDLPFIEDFGRMLEHRITWVIERDERWAKLTPAEKAAMRTAFDLRGGAR